MLRTLAKLAITYAVGRALSKRGKQGSLLDALLRAKFQRRKW